MQNPPLVRRLGVLVLLCLVSVQVLSADLLRRELHQLYRAGDYYRCYQRAHRAMDDQPRNAVPPFYAALSIAHYRKDARLKKAVGQPHTEIMDLLAEAKERDPNENQLADVKRPLQWMQKVLFRHGEKAYEKHPEGVRSYFDQLYALFPTRAGLWANRYHSGIDLVHEDYDFEEWDHPFFRLAHTARYERHLPEEAAQVLYLHNLVRLDPVRFERTYLRRWVELHPYSNFDHKYFRSLVKDLQNAEPAGFLRPEVHLQKASRAHARDLHQSGTFSHSSSNGTSFSARLSHHGVKSGYRAENIAAGQDDPIEVLLDLLIDRGVPSLGHRENILNPHLHHIGVGVIQEDDNWKIWVFDFSS